MKPHRIQLSWLAVAALLLAPLIAQARIHVVSLPGRDTVQLTIYNSENLTLVKETRHLTLKQGLNRLEFSWANTLIDPTSVEFRPVTHADAVEVVDVSFPPRVTNTLEWRVQSEVAGEVVVEIRYFTSGITWAADYVVQAAGNEQAMNLQGFVKVTNQSGEDYENAQIRLVVGVIRLVERIEELARLGRPGPIPVPPTAPAPAILRRMAAQEAVVSMDALAMARPKEVLKEGVSEYFLYTVEGRDTIPNGWARRIRSFNADAVPITSYYKFENERWGDQVMRHYRFTNSVPSHLGQEPLPDGRVQAFRIASQDNLYDYVGATSVKYIPINETVEMELGHDPEVQVKPKLMNWEKVDIRFDGDGNVAGWTIRESWEISLQNSRGIDVMVDVRRNVGGDWSLETDEPVYEKVDADTFKFVQPLKAGEKKSLTYELETHHGLNIRR